PASHCFTRPLTRTQGLGAVVPKPMWIVGVSLSETIKESVMRSPELEVMDRTKYAAGIPGGCGTPAGAATTRYTPSGILTLKDPSGSALTSSCSTSAPAAPPAITELKTVDTAIEGSSPCRPASTTDFGSRVNRRVNRGGGPLPSTATLPKSSRVTGA